MFLTETWLKPDEYNWLAKLCPSEYGFFNLPRPSGRGGGLAAIDKKQLKCSPVPLSSFSSFEVLAFKICGIVPILAIIYRPPKYNASFLSELSEF